LKTRASPDASPLHFAARVKRKPVGGKPGTGDAEPGRT